MVFHGVIINKIKYQNQNLIRWLIKVMTVLYGHKKNYSIFIVLICEKNIKIYHYNNLQLKLSYEIKNISNRCVILKEIKNFA